MSEEQFQALQSLLTDVKSDTNKIRQQIGIVDKRLSLIEQRLENIEPWISVNNDHLKYQKSEKVNA